MTDFNKGSLICAKCGSSNREGSLFCSSCGRKLIKEQVVNKVPVREAAYTKNTYTFPNIELYVMKQDSNSVDEAKEKIMSYLKKM